MTALSEDESKRRLGDWLPLCREQRTFSPEEAADFTESAAAGTDFVAKASGVAHKSEGNLVRLGLSAEAVQLQWSDLALAGDGSVLVADMVRPDFELLLGATRDEQFGPVLTVGHGGIMTEVLDDAVCFLDPLQSDDFVRGLSELRCAALLRGFRGKAPADVHRLYELGQRLLNAMNEDPEIDEIDLNPVAVVDGQPVVLDALVVLATNGHARSSIFNAVPQGKPGRLPS